MNGLRLGQLGIAFLLPAMPPWSKSALSPPPEPAPVLLSLQVARAIGLLAAIPLPFVGQALFKRVLAARQPARPDPRRLSAGPATRCLLPVQAAGSRASGCWGPAIASGGLMLAAAHGLLAAAPYSGRTPCCRWRPLP
ncbi:MAG TPA: hypothetical protein VNK67_02510 [Burkholderiales bacterium]|nr:hypothetical protein [Burkholderiales bacterium]